MKNSENATVAKQTTTSFALLGLLALRPWTTYELAKQVQRSVGWFWSRAERKLYDEPKALVAAGLAKATAGRTGKRPRTTYSITPAGRRALRAWLDEESVPPSLEFDAMVKVFFADAGTLEQLRATLAAIEATAVQRRALLRSMVASGAPEFADRQAINALGMRFQLDHEQLIAELGPLGQRAKSRGLELADGAEWMGRRGRHRVS